MSVNVSLGHDAKVCTLDAAIVDLDGTMVDTIGDFAEAITRMLADLQLHTSDFPQQQITDRLLLPC